MKLNKFSDAAEIFVVSTALTAVTVVSCTIISAATPKIEDYVFLVDRNRDGIAEQYIVRDSRLEWLDPLTRDTADVSDRPLEAVIYEMFRFDISGSPSWTAQGLSLRPERTVEEDTLLMDMTYCELSSYIIGECPK
jgi:hypothetical protein